MRSVLIIAGPTAAGKTQLAIDLAQQYDAEIVSADSRQIYRDMPIGTASPTVEQLAAVRHHLVGFLDPRERYSAARFAGDATAAIVDIHERGKGAIVVGGTGFYVRALTGGIELAAQYDERLRGRLAHEAQIHPAEFLHEWLRQRDAKRAAALDPHDTYRVLRALEVALASPEAVQRESALQTLVTAKIPFRKLFLDVPLAELDERIERRTASMISSGLLDEAERIGTGAVAATAVGYPQALAYLSGWSTAEELQASLARATRRYARRQRSWFRTEAGVKWSDRAGVEAAARENFSAA